MVRGEKLITPALTDAVLESITRDSVIQLARSMGFEVQERTIDRTELYTADEAFLCGSAMELTPVISIDGYELNAGAITQKIHEAYLSAAMGMSEEFSDWVTAIYE